MEHELLFQNPVFNLGLNVTVRNGDKWMKVGVGDKLLIKATGQKDVFATGIVVGKALLPMKLVPASLLKHEHDPSCRNLKGLVAEMQKIYPEITENNLVTVLLFKL